MINLSQTYALLGRLPAALATVSQALGYAEQSQNAFLKIPLLALQAWFNFLCGDSASALRMMNEAEDIYTRRHLPKKLFLYSVQGFLYCEILLTQKCSATDVAKRANQALIVAKSEDWLLDQGLDHHTLAKCELLLSSAAQSNITASLQAALTHSQTSLRLIRQSNESDFIVPALLTHARILCSLQDFNSALVALNEAHAIARRCGMRLYETDTLLARLELFGATQPYPWPDSSPAQDHQRAGALIQECGYGLRQAEWENLRPSH